MCNQISTKTFIFKLTLGLFVLLLIPVKLQALDSAKGIGDDPEMGVTDCVESLLCGKKLEDFHLLERENQILRDQIAQYERAVGLYAEQSSELLRLRSLLAIMHEEARKSRSKNTELESVTAIAAPLSGIVTLTALKVPPYRADEGVGGRRTIKLATHKTLLLELHENFAAENDRLRAGLEKLSAENYRLRELQVSSLKYADLEASGCGCPRAVTSRFATKLVVGIIGAAVAKIKLDKIGNVALKRVQFVDVDRR